MKGLLLLLTAAVPCIGLMHAPAVANLVQNGNFATGDLTSWDPLNVSISGNYGGPVTQFVNGPETGTIFVFLRDIGFGAEIATDIGVGAITQTLPTVPGQSYRVHYLVRVLTSSFGSFGRFAAIFDDIAYMGADPTTGFGFPPFPPLPPGSPFNLPAFYVAGTYDESFVSRATGSSTVIEFASSCPACDFFITQISVDPVPQSATLLLLFTGLLGLWLSTRSVRRR